MVNHALLTLTAPIVNPTVIPITSGVEVEQGGHMRFGKRKGFEPAEKTLQKNDMDQPLRNRLWSVLQLCVWNHWQASTQYRPKSKDTEKVDTLALRLWVHFFVQPLDTLPPFKAEHPTFPNVYGVLRKHVMEADWWRVYNLIEFVLDNVPDEWATSCVEFVNNMLEIENAAYRVIGTVVTDITDENEMRAVDDARGQPFPEVRSHLEHALKLLSDRQKPDYRNSIKESISAVEAVTQRISGKKVPLGDALKQMRVNCPMHPAFEKAMSGLYGYTSDGGGIRHALTEDATTPSFADAKYMLVACSAFVNFVITKLAEAGPPPRPKVLPSN